MRTLKIVAALAVALVVGLSPVVAHAQTNIGNFNNFLGGSPILRGNGAISTNVGILIRYVGATTAGGTVTVAGANITLSQGAVGGSVADATVACGGGGNGIIVTSNASCNTMKKVVDAINASANWVAVLRDTTGADSSNTMFSALSEAAANDPEGKGLLLDGTATFQDTISVTQFQDLTSYTIDTGIATARGRLKPNPFAGLQPIIFTANETNTYGSGTSAYRVICAATSYAQSPTRVLTETTTVFATPGAATTVANAFTFAAGNGFSCPTGQRMLARVYNSAAMTAAVHYVSGRVWRPLP